MTDDHKTQETSEFEQITPAKLDISPAGGASASAAGTTQAKPDQGVKPQRFYFALIALLLFAGLLFWTLPQLVGTPEVALEQPTVPPTVLSRPAALAESPWQEAQRSRERKVTQDILAEFLDLQFALEEKRVDLWGLADFNAAKLQAATGDEAYRAQEFAQATAHYQDGLATLQSLVTQTDTVVIDYLAKGAAALLDGDSVAAREAYELVLEVDPLNATAVAGLERSATLDEVFGLYGKALAAEGIDELNEALGFLEAALSVDPEFAQALQSKREVEAKILERDYSRAMSSGFSLLAQRQYAAADRAFRRAAGLKPGSAEAQDGINQVALTLTQNKIAALEQEARGFEASEAWQSAKEVFESVLSLDSSVVFAQEGVARTATRVRLDELLEQAKNNPERLSTPSVNQETRQLLQVARTVRQPGPRLIQQINTIEAQLDIAMKPVPVTLLSDSETDVTLYKVGHLGSFETHQLSLRPGTYAMVGKRLGYHDVRKEFVVAHGASQQPITITCTEKI